MDLLGILTDLARFGRVGPVEVGVDWDTVVGLLGEPWDAGSNESWPHLYAYGDLELSVCRCGKVVVVCLQTWRAEVELPVGPAERLTFPGRPEYAGVIGALGRARCAWQPDPSLTFDGQVAIRTSPTTASLVFETSDDDADPALNVAAISLHEHECPVPGH